MPELETRLARERESMLDAIDQPPLERLGARAASIRHRRRARRAAAVLAVVAVAGFAGLRPWSTDQKPPPVADPSPSPGVVYTDAGITINGLTGEGFIDPPGQITDVEFADPDHGYALVQCGDDSCPPSLARSADGGVTWTPATLPSGLGRRLDLIAFPDGRILVGGYVSADAGHSWRPTARATGRPATVGKGELLRLGDGGIEVWSSTYGNRGGLTNQPLDMTVHWVADVPTATGAWWVAGVQDLVPAVAVTRDGGRTWTVERLEVAGGTAQVSVLGNHVYAIAIGPGRAIAAIYKSVDAGQRFTRTTTGRIAVPGELSGEVVPLLDGRLLIIGTDRRWYLSDDDGRTFTQATGTLPAVQLVLRTTAGYVAYDLFNADWAAFSADGSTWRKLQVN